MNIKMRLAAFSDAASLARIYRPYVENTTVTLEYDVPDVSEFRRRIEEISAELPYIVCEADGVIIGYAYAHKYKERFGYRFAAELSVYLDETSRRHGVGTALYSALIEMVTALGYTNLCGVVTSPNPASFALHTKLGFYEAGRERLAGCKFGRQFDVVRFEKLVGEVMDTDDVSEWRRCPRTPSQASDELAAILQKYNDSSRQSNA